MSADQEERLFWYLVAAYVADSVGLLDEKQDGRLPQIAERTGDGPWR